MERLKNLFKDKRLWAVAAVGAALGFGVLMSRRGGGGSGPSPEDEGASISGPALPGIYSSAGTDLYNDVQPSIEALQRQLENLGGLYDELSGQVNGDPVNPPPGVTTTWESHHVQPGTLREIAGRFARSPDNPTAVESTLRRIVDRNPWIREKGLTGSSRLDPSILEVPVHRETE